MPSRNRHDPTNPHPVAVVSDEECPELTGISPGLSGITQAGEGLSMIASLAMGWWGGGGTCIAACARVQLEANVREKHFMCIHLSFSVSGATSRLLSAHSGADGRGGR